MPKVTMRFDLETESEDFEMALKGSYYLAVIEELDNFLRGKIKYAPDSVPEAHIDIYQEVRDKLNDLRRE